LAAWRQDFRNFRVDRMSEIRLLDENFATLPGRTLQDFLRKMRAQ